MATLFEITYEGHTAGATIGTESGWDTTTNTRVYDATYVAAGTMGCKITDQGILRKNVTAIASTRMRWYMMLPVADPVSTIATLGSLRSSTTNRAQARLEVGGTLRLYNVTTATGSSSAPLTNGEAVRCEWWTNGGAGTQGMDIFRGVNVNGFTPDEQLSGTFTNNTYDNMGVMSSVNIIGFVVYTDEVLATDVPGTMIGPAITGSEDRLVLGAPTTLNTEVAYDLATGGIISATVTTPPDRGAVLDWTLGGTPGTTVVPADTIHTETLNGADPTDVSKLGVVADPEDPERY